MRKLFIGLLFVVGVLLLGWEMQRYATSGTEYTSISLLGTGDNAATVSLREDMSPVRMLLSVEYEMHIDQGANSAYDYRVELRNTAKESLVLSDQIHVVQHADQGSAFEANTQNHIIGTFTVPANATYEIQWQLDPKKAVVSRASLKFRQQVSPLNIYILIGAGLCFVFGGFILFSGRKKYTRVL